MLRAPSRHAAQLLQAAGEAVAHALELSEPEQGWSTDGRTFAALGAGRGDIGEGVGEDRRDLALEPCDLRLQRLPRGPLGRSDRAPIRGEGITIGRPGRRGPSRDISIDYLLLALVHIRLLPAD
jgi:hypothetical protein